MESRPDDKFWQSDEYLKQNAAGAHSNSHVIISELQEIKAHLAKLETKLETIDRNCWALGFGLAVVMLFVWKY